MPSRQHGWSTVPPPGKREHGRLLAASLRNDVFPRLRERPISEIQPRDIRDVVQAIERGGAGETAGRVFQRLRSIFRYAVAHELTTTDPTYALKPAEIFKPRKLKHRVSISRAEASDFLRRLEDCDRSPSTQNGFDAAHPHGRLSRRALRGTMGKVR